MGALRHELQVIPLARLALVLHLPLPLHYQGILPWPGNRQQLRFRLLRVLKSVILPKVLNSRNSYVLVLLFRLLFASQLVECCERKGLWVIGTYVGER